MRKTVFILYGGRSVEHAVSVNSARNIFQFIDRKKYNPVAIGISESGVWYHTGEVTSEIKKKGEPLRLSLNSGKPVFETQKKKIKADIIFPVLHGTDGEDGSIQGLIKAINLPMVGTGVLGSAMSMSKLVAKKMLMDAGIPVSDYISFSYPEKKAIVFSELEKKLGLPFMVKSANLGSSVGVSKVKSEQDFKKAVNEAFRYDDCILIEKFIRGREIECAVLGNAPPRASRPGEIIVSKEYEFYTFDAKYVDNQAVQINVPAILDEAISQKIQALSVRAYRALFCEDFARVDLFLTAEGQVYVNEINTIPGFTNSSMFPMMWNERGISFPNLISRLIELAEKRFKKSLRINRGYASSLKY